MIDNNQMQGPKVVDQQFEPTDNHAIKVSTTFLSELEFDRDRIDQTKDQLNNQLKKLMGERRKLDQAIEAVKHNLEDLANIESVYEEHFGQEPQGAIDEAD